MIRRLTVNLRGVWDRDISRFHVIRRRHRQCSTRFYQIKMAPLERRRVCQSRSWTAGNAYPFAFYLLLLSFLFYHSPLLLLFFVLNGFPAVVLYFRSKQSRTQSSRLINSRNPFSGNENGSSPSRELKEDCFKSMACADVEPTEPWHSKFSRPGNSKLSFDQFSTTESEMNVRNPEQFSSVGIQDIVSLLHKTNCAGANLNITADGVKQPHGLFPDVGML